MANVTRIAASILAADFARLGEQVREADQGGAGLIHVDVMDGRFVPNLTLGAVVIEAIISKTGRVESVNVVSGPDMLREAARSAVAAAKYRPYLLNGEPTEVRTTYTVVFSMGG